MTYPYRIPLEQCSLHAQKGILTPVCILHLEKLLRNHHSLYLMSELAGYFSESAYWYWSCSVSSYNDSVTHLVR